MPSWHQTPSHLRDYPLPAPNFGKTAGVLKIPIEAAGYEDAKGFSEIGRLETMRQELIIPQGYRICMASSRYGKHFSQIQKRMRMEYLERYQEVRHIQPVRKGILLIRDSILMLLVPIKYIEAAIQLCLQALINLQSFI